MFAACSPVAETAPVAPRDNAQAPVAPAVPVAPAAPVAPEPAPAGPALAIDGEGLRLFDRDSGSARPIAFGTMRAATMAALAFRGPAETGTQGECGAGALEFAAWKDGLKLYFQRDRFVGWAVDARGKGVISTAAGIGVGSSRADLAGAYAATFSTTSLGSEFAAGGLFGLLDGPGDGAHISDLWAGTSCNFR